MRNAKELQLLHAILAASVLFSALPAAEGADAGPGGNEGHGIGGSRSKVGSSEWQVLTKRNFSSEIQRHPHVLVMVTVPWSGESRSLMKQVAHKVTDSQQLFGHVKLMVVYRNLEKILADDLDATEGVSLLYYHHLRSFRYRGRLRAQNILSSISHIMSLQHVEVPLKFLNTVEELENFLQSTDKAVLLLEFCGWAATLLHNMNNGTKGSPLSEQNLLHYGDMEGGSFTNEADGTPFGRNENQKGSENEKVTCGADNELSGVPWLEDFSQANKTSLGIEDTTSNTGTACTLDKLQQFESFFSELNKIAREFFLPPERQRFGVISEKSLLPFLGVGEPEAWLLLIYFSGFPNLSKTLEDINELRTALRMHHSGVVEVDRDQKNQERAFRVNGLSIILFIDRSSESPRIREESTSALDVYRQFAHHYQLLNQKTREQGLDHLKISPMQQEMQNKGLFGPYHHMMARGLSSSRIVKVENKMAFMIADEGGSIPLDKIAGEDHNNPLSDVLQHLLHQENSAVKTKEIKLSLLAKEIGFQLLSDDFDVEVINLQPPHQEGDQFRSTSENFIGRPDNENLEHFGSNANVHDDRTDTSSVAAAEERKQSELIVVKSVFQWNPVSTPSGKSTTSLASGGSSQESSKDDIQLAGNTVTNEDVNKPVALSPLVSHSKIDLQLKQNLHGGEEPTKRGYLDTSIHLPANEAFMEADIIKEKLSTGVGNLNQQQLYHHAFTGSFFFSDGGYQLLRRLTGDSKIPSVVIVDPVLHRHYVLPKETNLTFDSLVSFVDKFLNGSLPLYQHSEPTIQSPRETLHPPFVNLDFHEADGIPRVTANTFSELVRSSADCDDGERMQPLDIRRYVCAGKGDVLVLFSNSWCGFCQRMELVVREVYRALKYFKNLLSDPTGKLEEASIHDLPSIYHMDCTLNDCSSFLRQYSKGEVYPSLVLFPAEKKDAITYEGDVSVLEIFEFLVNHGRNSHKLNECKGILWNHARKGHGNGERLHDASPIIINEQTPVSESDDHGDFHSGGNDHQPADLHVLHSSPEERERMVVGSILTATDKLLNAFPFDKSSILIVKADQNEGFQGLILNKHASWDIFEKLDKELGPLKQAPLSYGGPVRMRDLPLISLAQKPVTGYSKVAGNLYFGDPFATSLAVEEIRSGIISAGDLWFFLGYSSWGWNQLFDELAEGDWQVGVLSLEHLDWPEV